MSAAVDLAVVVFGFFNGIVAIGEVAEINTIVVCRHPIASGGMHLVIAVVLRILVDVVAGHNDCEV